MSKIRLRYSKTGSARYISHLDLMRTMKRSFLRAGVDLKYTQGFNPHPYMSVALPLPVGCGSVCELVDVELPGDTVPDGLPDMLTGSMPESIRVLEAYIPQRKFSDIARIRLKGRLIYDSGADDKKLEQLAAFLSREGIIIDKKTKSGVSELDIAPHICGLSLTQSGDKVLTLSITVSAQNPSITPDNLIGALKKGGIAPDYAEFERVELYDMEGEAFR